MSNENLKAQEIKRLTTPLTIKNSKAYDSNGKLLNCVETLTDVRFMNEPNPEILTDNEIIKYAPESREASRIRLKRGFGNMSDVLLVNQSLPWILGLYYCILFCIAIPLSYEGNRIGMFLVLLLCILPLIYLYHIFNLKRYPKRENTKKQVKPTQKTETKKPVVEKDTNSSFTKYEKEINNLKVVFDVKEEVVRDLIKKRFEPPQITYDRFISSIDSCHKIFYEQLDSALNITKLASEETPRIEEELKNKIDTMKSIINQIEDLTNELIINISSDEESSEDVNVLLEDMENLIDSVKKY